MNPGLAEKMLNFTVTGLKKGPGNVLIVEGYLTVRQSHVNNIETVGNLLKKETIKYFEHGKDPKTL